MEQLHGTIKPESFYEILFKFVGTVKGSAPWYTMTVRESQRSAMEQLLVIKGTVKRDVLTGLEDRLTEAGVQSRQ